jgi:hypothetical protein
MAKKKTAKKSAKKKTAKKKVAKKTTKKKAVAKKKVVKKKTTKKVAKKKAAKKKAAKKTSKKKVAAKKAAKKKVTTKKVTKKATKKASASTAPAKKKTEKVKAEKSKDKKLAPPVQGDAPAKVAKTAATTKSAPAAEAKKIVIQKDIVLTDAEGRILCRVRDCDQPAVVENYCRYHYLLFWKKIQIRKKILSEGKLEKYIEELTSRYPNKYLDLIKKDLSTESDFLHAIQELEIDESSDDDDSRDYDEERSFIEEVRGVSDSSDREESDY